MNKAKFIGSKVKEQVARFTKEEDGAGVIEVILIIVIVVGLIAVFKSSITGLVDSGTKQFQKDSKSIILTQETTRESGR